MERIKMILVEDDEGSREILAAVIGRKFKDLLVYTAANGKEGLELFSQQMPELLLTDINMPRMSGLQLAQKARELKPETIVIVITADTGKAALERSAGEGFVIDHYVYKPLDYQKLFTAIEESIRTLLEQTV